MCKCKNNGSCPTGRCQADGVCSSCGNGTACPCAGTPAPEAERTCPTGRCQSDGVCSVCAGADETEVSALAAISPERAEVLLHELPGRYPMAMCRSEGYGAPTGTAEAMAAAIAMLAERKPRHAPVFIYCTDGPASGPDEVSGEPAANRDKA